jgi:hypothetical protein
MKIVVGGSVQGWFVSLCITTSIFIMIILGLLDDKIAERWSKLGTYITTAYLGQFTAWLGYRVFKTNANNS